MDLKAKNELADLNKRRVTYERALEQVRATAEQVQQDLQDAHPLPGLRRAMSELDLLVTGCDSKIKRIEEAQR